MDSDLKKRIRSDRGESLIVSAEEAAGLIKDGMAVGISGFTNAGYPKAVPHALAELVKAGKMKVKIDLYSGASVGPEVDTELVEAGVIGKRIPYQTNATLRKAINKNDVQYRHASRKVTGVRISGTREEARPGSR